MSQVIIGTDPHKGVSTIEVVDRGEAVLAAGRYGTDRDGDRMMMACWANRWKATPARHGRRYSPRTERCWSAATVTPTVTMGPCGCGTWQTRPTLAC
jgi:hypothetical protein